MAMTVIGFVLSLIACAGLVGAFCEICALRNRVDELERIHPSLRDNLWTFRVKAEGRLADVEGELEIQKGTVERLVPERLPALVGHLERIEADAYEAKLGVETLDKALGNTRKDVVDLKGRIEGLGKDVDTINEQMPALARQTWEDPEPDHSDVAHALDRGEVDAADEFEPGGD